MEVEDSDLVESAWKKYEQLVLWCIWRIQRHYGGDFEELYSEALLLFTECVLLYDESRGSLGNWIQFRLQKQLFDRKRTEARHLRCTGRVSSLSDISDIYQPDCALGEILRDLSEDARWVVNVLFSLDCKHPKNRTLTRLEIRRELHRDNWDNNRINSCFREIEAALIT